jgi:hypothetical protein
LRSRAPSCRRSPPPSLGSSPCNRRAKPQELTT